MYKIKNIIENKIIFQSDNVNEFTNFVRKIAVENEDEELSITCLGEAVDYLDNYCDNLEIVNRKTIFI